MDDVIDFSRPMAPSASQKAAAVTGGIRHFNRPPVPLGKPITISKPSPLEEEALLRAGWDGKSAVPDNFHELISLAEEDQQQHPLAETKLAENFRLQIPAEQDISQLPADKQAELKSWMKDVFDESDRQRQELLEQAEMQGSGIENSVLGAIQMADKEPEIELPKRLHDKQVVGTVPEQIKRQETLTSSGGEAAAPVVTSAMHCKRCGHSSAHEFPVPMDSADWVNYLQTLGGKTPFVKIFKLWQGKLTLILRSLFSSEVDAIEYQLMLDEQHGRLTTDEQRKDLAAQYRAALQLVEFRNAANPQKAMVRRFAPSLDVWKTNLGEPGNEQLAQGVTVVRKVWEFVREHAFKNETMLRVVLQHAQDLNFLFLQMEAKSSDPNFTPPADTSAA